jgi:hypothetical protein
MIKQSGLYELASFIKEIENLKVEFRLLYLMR